MEEFSQRELLLLSNFMYYHGTAAYDKNITLGDLAQDLLDGHISKNDLGGNFKENDFRECLTLIANNEKLSSLRLSATTPRNSDINAACFVTPAGKPVVAFEGTGGIYYAWKDNLLGDIRSDTSAQKQASVFVKQMEKMYPDEKITVTGHSKGGNMAMYCGITCDNVDKVVSFDGQGFSDEFVAKNEDKIQANKGKITNICAHNDFVNTLLNSIVPAIYINNSGKGIVGGHSSWLLYKSNDHEKYGDFTKEDSRNQSLNKGVLVTVKQITENVNNKSDIKKYKTVGILSTAAGFFGSCTSDSGSLTLDELASQLITAVKRAYGYHTYFSAEYTVNINVLKIVIENLNNQENQMEQIKQRLYEQLKVIRPTSPAIKVIDFLILKLSNEIGIVKNKIKRLSGGLISVASIYENSENVLLEMMQ